MGNRADSIHCPSCGSFNIQTNCKPAMLLRCREKAYGRKRFSTKTHYVELLA